jgi:formate dehydrogenase (coenzyme F420) beta subunit
MIEQLRQRARELLEKGEVALVIGHGEGRSPETPVPVFVRKPDEVARLVMTPFCRINLATYLTRKEVMPKGKVALVAQPEEVRSVSVLVQEQQFEAERVVLLGVVCEKPGVEGAACRALKGATLKELEAEVAEICKSRNNAELAAKVKELDGMTPEQRFAFWEKEFARCIRCYACRQACPMCYCERCIVEKNQPQWIPASPRPVGNYAWNVIRAFHLAGRCIACGACARACPMDIPIDILNKKVAQEVKDSFGVEAGFDHAAPPPMASFRTDDAQEFIK